MGKPRIKRGMLLLTGWPVVFVNGWHCCTPRACGQGMTPLAAYLDWKRATKYPNCWTPYQTYNNQMIPMGHNPYAY